MATFLIIYGTKQGQSKKIATYIREILSQANHGVDLYDIHQVPRDIELKKYDAVIIGAGVHMSGYTKALQRWVSHHRFGLFNKHAAFFSVCLGVLQNDPKVHEQERSIMQSFFTKTGWAPNHSAIFAGALPYSKYNWILKLIMHRIAKKAGTNTSMRRDYEFTDWNEVRQFALSFASSIRKTRERPSASLPLHP